MNYQNKQIGIWGFGRVGKATARFLKAQGASIIVYDDDPDHVHPNSFDVACSREDFFDKSELIIPSPGVDINPYKNSYRGVWLTELDLFQQFFHKPIIAITGSVGKTTVTHILTQALKKAGWVVEAAGNIGTPCIEMVYKNYELDAVVLEVSSFQLEHITSFSPDLALWTNFYPNHLDRHGTMHDYFRAKCNIFKYQHNQHSALLPLDIQDMLGNSHIDCKVHFFSEHAAQDHQGELFYIEKKTTIASINSGSETLIDMNSLDQSVFPVNWLVVYAALHLLRVPLRPMSVVMAIEHRLELVATINTINFYNDSKSTTPASTLAALEQIHAPRIILFLGGLSKGVDRSKFVELLASKRVHVLCFGAEAESLRAFCTHHSIPAHAFAMLEDAFQQCVMITQPHDCVLFSPAGSSFDLFENYQVRGACFKQLVKQYQESL